MKAYKTNLYFQISYNKVRFKKYIILKVKLRNRKVATKSTKSYHKKLTLEH
jgi:hypothetical protein